MGAQVMEWVIWVLRTAVAAGALVMVGAVIGWVRLGLTPREDGYDDD